MKYGNGIVLIESWLLFSCGNLFNLKKKTFQQLLMLYVLITINIYIYIFIMSYFYFYFSYVTILIFEHSNGYNSCSISICCHSLIDIFYYSMAYVQFMYQLLGILIIE